ncbi:hypothetical protein PBCV1_a599R [Paramecium bursaria Chlorella virus 1]|uniref:Uncharacterized protein n=1 Tax=Paramecium bursaria Chlorella virus 1 TaxID=10506 RepID=O41081_PBCV1|nr:hypothetical protein PBCV1_a599R [Paramecium bursaria Chlorella virus 1]AAC97020.1 hypothetical protein [Paramecium bursaria Chlorella virus 1]
MVQNDSMRPSLNRCQRPFEDYFVTRFFEHYDNRSVVFPWHAFWNRLSQTFKEIFCSFETVLYFLFEINRVKEIVHKNPGMSVSRPGYRDVPLTNDFFEIINMFNMFFNAHENSPWKWKSRKFMTRHRNAVVKHIIIKSGSEIFHNETIESGIRMNVEIHTISFQAIVNLFDIINTTNES